MRMLVCLLALLAAAADGGGLFVDAGCNCTLRTTVVQDNVAASSGGASEVFLSRA